MERVAALGAVGAPAGSLLAGRLAARYGDAVLIRVVPIMVAGAGLLLPLTTAGKASPGSSPVRCS